MTFRRLHTFTFGTALALGLACCPGATRAQDMTRNMLTNGSFEANQIAPDSLTEVSTGATGALVIDGWTGNYIAGNAHEYLINGDIQDLQGRNIGVTPYGSQYLGLNAVYRRSFRSIESQVADGFTAGQTYLLTVYIANLDGASDPKISVAVSDQSGTGTLLNSQTFTAPLGEGPYGAGNSIDFVPETLTFTAKSNKVSISIGNQSLTGIMGIDNVSVVAVPEPGTLGAVALGAGALVGGFAVRRRRQEKGA